MFLFPIVAVQAIDTDIGSNGAIRYRMRPDPLGNHRSFDIDSVTGMITLTQGLDRERQKIYELRVEAYDLGKETYSGANWKIFKYCFMKQKCQLQTGTYSTL